MVFKLAKRIAKNTDSLKNLNCSNLTRFSHLKQIAFQSCQISHLTIISFSPLSKNCTHFSDINTGPNYKSFLVLNDYICNWKWVVGKIKTDTKMNWLAVTNKNFIWMITPFLFSSGLCWTTTNWYKSENFPLIFKREIYGKFSARPQYFSISWW